ncbi:MAG: tellurite resistance protein [Paracoccaceae bacterium]|jgi:tellurite resistance protein
MLNGSALWRATPPAIFPVCLGFMGLGLAWRKAATVTVFPPEIGNLLLGLSTAFFTFFVCLYLAKMIARPSVLLEDMLVPPARAGIAAMAMTMMLLAAALLQFGFAVPLIWWTGVAMQIIAIVIVIRAIWIEPREVRAFTPFMYLTFVGLIVAPIAGIPLGHVTQSIVLAIAAFAAFVIITIGYGGKLFRVRPPAPLRPTLTIILAPLSLFALSAGMLGMLLAFWVFYTLSWAAAVVLLALGRWMMAGGWSPVWATFTFPITAFTTLQVLALGQGAGVLAIVGIYAGLAIATPLIGYVVYRAVLAFVTGELAKKTGAATA